MSKILVVDDEKSIRTLYEETLTDDGHDVITIGQCDGVLELVIETEPALVVLDIRLEDCDGLDLLQRLRIAHPDLPIILNTAYDSYREDVKAVAADGYVLKSPDLTTLKREIKSILENMKIGG